MSSGMLPQPPASRGLSISARLILATTLVVAIAAAASAWFGQRAIDELAQSGTAARRARGERAIGRESELAVRAVASAVALPLGTSSYAELPAILDAAMRDDTQRGGRSVQWLVVVDVGGQVVARTEAAPAGERLTELAARASAAPREGASDVVRIRLDPARPDWVWSTTLRLGEASIGALHMGVSTAELEAELAASLREASATAAAARQRIWLVGGGVLALGILFALIQGVRLARPIGVLTAQAQRIAGGDLHERVPADRGDELGALAHSFNFMADRIGTLLVEQAHKASLEREMSLARDVQQAMLPPTTLDQHGHLKVIGHCAPASSCGGDWWTYRKLSGERMLVVIGDATGHGLHSAMIAGTARGAVEALGSVDERLLTPEHVLRAIDAAIRNLGEHNVLMTCFAAVLDSATGVLHYANAGQNFPYVLKMSEQRAIESAGVIVASGNPLGDRAIELQIRRGSQQLRPGDLVVMFTDGLVERANPSGKLFGDRRLRGALQGQSVADAAALVTLRDRLLGAVEAFAAGQTAEDDTTLILCHYDPPAARASRVSLRSGGA